MLPRPTADPTVVAIAANFEAKIALSELFFLDINTKLHNIVHIDGRKLWELLHGT